jgi:cytochrome c5
MARVLALLLTLTLLFQTSWASAAPYCQHESSPQAVLHVGHHTHVHHAASGAQAGGKLALDTDCTSCHAGHAAIVPTLCTFIASAAPAALNFGLPAIGVSAPPGEPERPQWLRLA